MMPQLSLVISVYKNVRALQLIFKSLARQQFKGFEVIIAEDDEDIAIKGFVENALQNYHFPIIHLHQQDNGFQKDKMLNAAIRNATTGYLVFIDGDCLMHPAFLKEHFKHRQKGYALFGRRVMLSKKFTDCLYSSGEIAGLDPLSLWQNKCRRLDCSFYLPFMATPVQRKPGIWGCNWSIHKEALLAVNGFDEDYELPGFGEDTDIEWRLFAHGILLKKLKYQAIQYHLDHPLNYRSVEVNRELLAMKKASGRMRSLNGLEKLIG